MRLAEHCWVMTSPCCAERSRSRALELKDLASAIVAAQTVDLDVRRGLLRLRQRRLRRAQVHQLTAAQIVALVDVLNAEARRLSKAAREGGSCAC